MKYASLWRRSVAVVIDIFVLYFTTFIVSFAYALIFGVEQSESIALYVLYVLIGLIEIFLGWIYPILMEASPFQATIGKLLMKIKVTDLKGRKISILRSTVRNLSVFISVFSVIGIVVALHHKKKQTLHDMIAGCVVVKNQV